MKFETKPPQNRAITVADGQRTEIYRGTVVDLGLETARLPNGELLNLEIVRHPGGAAILALDKQNHVCLLRQYRHSIGKWIWELPAGVIEKRATHRNSQTGIARGSGGGSRRMATLVLDSANTRILQ